MYCLYRGYTEMDFSMGLLLDMVLRNPSGNAGDMDWEDLLEKGMATHSSIRAWEVPWTKQPGGLQSIGLQRVGYDLSTKQQQI